MRPAKGQSWDSREHCHADALGVLCDVYETAEPPVGAAKIVRAVLLRDGHCRIPGCEARHGLEVHHLRPRSWGGSDEISNLAAVCGSGGHHGVLVPTGRWALGNPNQPDGLRLVRVDELDAEGALQLGLPPPRAPAVA
jgi:hypothetical protein